MQPEEDNRSFSKDDRLTSSVAVKQLMAQHLTAFSFPIKCYYRLVDKNDARRDCRLAVIVAKKRFKNAVDRNRIKRLMRETYRNHKFYFKTPTTPPQQLQMCWLYVHNQLPNLALLTAAASSILQQIEKKLTL